MEMLVAFTFTPLYSISRESNRAAAASRYHTHLHHTKIVIQIIVPLDNNLPITRAMSAYSAVYGTTSIFAYSNNENGVRKFVPYQLIPVWLGGINSINKNCKEAYDKGVVKSSGISQFLKELLHRLFPKLKYYQYRPGTRHWLICPICLPRSGGNSALWRNMPVGDAEIVDDLVHLISGLTKFVVDKGVHEDDAGEIRFAAHLLPNRDVDAEFTVLKGDHYDVGGTKDNEKFFARGCIYLGGCRDVIFSADETTKEYSEGNKPNKVYQGVGKFTLDLTDGCGAYFTSPYMSGTYPLAWTNAEKTKGIQFKHKVIAKDNDVGCLLIFDFPFRTKELLDSFMSTHASGLVYLDLE